MKLIAKPGRFVEERNYELWMLATRLLVVKCFSGRPPHYGRWIEVFAVNPDVETSEGVFTFAGSTLERELLEALAGELRGGEVLYVEYGYDPETEALLRLGLSPYVTRLGYMLLNLGFTILKDFYFPEGFMEGEAKLQGEKPAGEAAERQQYLRVVREVERAVPILKRLAGEPKVARWAANALARAEAIMEV